MLIGSPDLKANHRITQIFDFPAEHEKYQKLVRILEKVRGRPGKLCIDPGRQGAASTLLTHCACARGAVGHAPPPPPSTGVPCPRAHRLQLPGKHARPLALPWPARRRWMAAAS